jgi:putative ABC transport system permease protein
VGVVGNVHQFGLDAGPTYDAYFAGGWPGHLLVRTASDPAAIANAVTGIAHEIDPSVPVNEVTTLDGLLSRSLSPRRFAMVLIGILAGLALILSAVGIYGVMSYTVGQRTQEIGVRMALGAQPNNMLALVLGRGAGLALVGIFAGTLGALALTRFLSSLLFGVASKIRSRLRESRCFCSPLRSQLAMCRRDGRCGSIRWWLCDTNERRITGGSSHKSHKSL